MSNASFNSGAVYVRDYILASLLGLQNGIGHTSPAGENDPEYQAYQKLYDLVSNRFGDMFTEFKG